jgi:hypothetical protein
MTDARRFPCHFPAVCLAGKILSLPAAKFSLLAVPPSHTQVSESKRIFRPEARSMFSWNQFFSRVFPCGRENGRPPQSQLVIQ